MSITRQPPASINGPRSQPLPTSPLGRLGAWSYQHRRLVLGAWIAALIAFSGMGRAVGSQFKDSINGGHTQAQEAATFLQRQFPARAGDTAEVVFADATPLTAPAAQTTITRTLDRISALPGVGSVSGPYGAQGAHQIDTDGRTAYAVIQFTRSGDNISNKLINDVVHTAKSAATSGLNVQLTGTPIEKVEKPKFGTSEGLGILAAILILLLAFGSIVAMILPIASAIVAVAGSFGILDLLSHGLTVPSFGPELAALVGLGVGIDYALFVVTRYRSTLAGGADPQTAVATAMATSGRAVLFAGITVVLSLLGLFLLGLPFIYGASLGAVTAVLMTIAASMTLLPAALGFAGDNIDRFHVGLRRRDRTAAYSRPAFWWRWSRQVQRRPWAAGGAALLALVVLALPFLSLRLSFTDAGTDPTGYTTRHAYDLLAKGFGPGASGPLVLAAQLPAGAGPAALDPLAEHVASLADVQSVSPPRLNTDGTAAVLTVVPRTAPQDAATTQLVKEIRNTVIPQTTAGTGIHVLVGGATAASIDTTGVIAQRLALVISIVILLSILLLATAFRSVVIPVASALMTLLSTGAAYGVMVAVFQWGWLGKSIDNGATAPVDPWVPVMLFTLLFGLSMDYQVFLVSRIREGWRMGHSDSDAVANGLAGTGRVITSAAAIMICVFGAFVLGDLRLLRVFGLAMAVAILLDATLVRMVLMPAALQLFGRANWWFPQRLHRMLPDLMHEEDTSPALVPAGGAE
jgi:putative drug exporter of the RND superfamily